MKKKLISILLCTIIAATFAGCGKKVDMDALREEIREEILEEMEAEQEAADRKAEKEALLAEKENEEEPVETEPVETPETPVKTPTAGSSTEWQSMTFTLDGKTYTLPFAYEDIKSEWNFNLADYGYENGYVMNPDQYVYSTIGLDHETYDCDFYIGLINNDSAAKDITECDIWSASVDITWARDSYPALELPGNLTWGSSLEEVEAVFGIPEETYYSEELGYWNYTYSVDYDSFSLTIYNDKGITEFGYKISTY